MKNSNRNLMMLGLVVALGANLSWNPELFLVAREDYKMLGLPQEIDFASTTPQNRRTEVASATGEIDLGKHDQKLKDTKVQYTILDHQGTKYIRYTVQGAKGDLNQPQSPSLSQENFNNAEALSKAIADNAIELIRKGQAATAGADTVLPKPEEKAKPEPRKKKRKLVKITSACDEDETADQIICEKDELSTIMESCSEDVEVDEEEIENLGSRRRRVIEENRNSVSRRGEGSKRAACQRKANAYYNKFLKKSIKEGLAAGSNSPEYQQAKATRDELFSEMSRKFDSTIKKDLVEQSAQGVVHRAREQYMSILSATRNQETATLAAKTYILNETSGTSAMELCQALSKINCMSTINNPMMRASLAGQNSDFKLFAERFESPLQSIATHQNTAIPFDALLNGDLTSGTAQTAQITAEIMAARTQGQRQNAAPIPGTGQGRVSVPGIQMPNPTGPISIPSNNPQSPVIQGPNGQLNGQFGQPQWQQPNQFGQQNWQQPNQFGQQNWNQPGNGIQRVVPGQPFQGGPFGNNNFGSNPSQYNPMAPVGQQQPINGGYPLSPAQRSGLRTF